jgi:hypothetical protein
LRSSLYIRELREPFPPHILESNLLYHLLCSVSVEISLKFTHGVFPINTDPAYNTILSYTPPEMNPFCEKEKSLTSQTHVVEPSKGEVTAVASNIICNRQGILESTRIHDGYEDVDACQKLKARVQSYTICLQQKLDKDNAHGQESPVGRHHSRWSSSTQVISNRPPSQPRSRHQMSGGSSSVSLKERHKKLVTGEVQQRGSHNFERLQQSESKWNSGSEALVDQPPLQPVSRHEISGPSDESRWSSGCHL